MFLFYLDKIYRYASNFAVILMKNKTKQNKTKTKTKTKQNKTKNGGTP